MNSNLLKKASSAALAAAIILNTSAFSSSITTAAGTKYEFEDGKTTGATVQQSGSERFVEGASGDKFVFLENAGEIASVTVTSEKTGMFEITLGFSAPYGDKIQNLLVNGVDQGQISFLQTKSGEWSEVSLGSVKLNAGENEVAVKSSWGWTNLDYLIVEEAELSEINASDIICADPDIIPEAQNLMNYMYSVYGEHIISGQQEIYKYGPHDFSYEFDYIENLTGELPAIRGFDYLNCNPLYGSDDGTTDRIIDWVKTNNGIATASWHINVPKNFTSYNIGDKVDWSQSTYSVKDESGNPATDFDTSKALVEGTKEYEYYMLCLEGLAAELQKLEDQNIPLIFRPLHEAEGGGGENGSWFWWGKSGSAVYKDLWILTYKTLTETYGLHNLIWEWNSYAYSTSENWYPGDDYVDLIAYDKYNCTDWSTGQAVLKHNDSAISSTFYTIMEKYGSKKMVAMSENDSIPALQNIIDEKAGWLYFCPWYDGGSDSTNFLSNEVFNKKEDLITMYQSDYCITLDELPADLYTDSDVVIKPTKPTEPTEPTSAPVTDPSEPATEEGFVFKIKTYPVELTSSGREHQLLLAKFEGTPGASIGGGLGFGTNADDWVNIEWNATVDSQGIANIMIPLADIPYDFSSAELQIWWSNVWDSATETPVDYDCDLVSYDIKGTGGLLPYEHGDTNLDNEVDINDAVLIMSYLANQTKYPLTQDQINAADVYQKGDGLSIGDANSIQKYLAKMIKELPES